MRLERRDYAFVGFQIILFILYFLDLHFLKLIAPSWIRVSSGIITIVGLLIILISILKLNTNLSVFPSPRSQSRLVTNGLFKLIRHPIYTGIIITSIGYAIYAVSVYKLLIALILYTLFYFKSIYEERKLSQQFSEYEAYKKTTGRFFPKFK